VIPKAAAQLVRGFLMGAADVVPGVSGGTIALVLGIYQHLIDSIRDAARALGTLLKGDLKGFWQRLVALDFPFLVPLGLGILIAVGSLASVIDTQLRDNPENMAGLFFGLVAASVAIALGLLTARDLRLYALMAAVTAIVFALLGFQSGPVSEPSALAFLGAGALAICAMILPGISGSFILLMIGMYSAVIQTVNDREIGNAALLLLGMVIGLALFSSVLGWVMDHAFNTVMATLIGLMIGSLRVLWPWPNGVGVISEDQSEVVNGTGLDWPAGDEWFQPTALAVFAVIVVLAIARVGTRFAAHSGD
jgi:putative membrane protein